MQMKWALFNPISARCWATRWRIAVCGLPASVEYSDYDLLVIKRTERPFLDRLRDMVPYLVQFDRPADVLVYTPEEFERMGETGLGWVIHKEGVVLYERSPD